MGKKTKKEKILAEYRRKLLALNSATNTLTTGKLIQYQLPKQKTQAVLAPIEALESTQGNFGYVVSDLKRISLLTILAICAQLVLWYFLGTRMIGK